MDFLAWAAEALSWGTVAVGLILSYLSVSASIYFRRQEQIAGGSWLLGVFLKTTLSIAAISIWLTLARAVTLTLGRQEWVSLVSGLAIIWLLLLPLFMEREFRSHEGRPDPRGQTTIEYGLLLALILVVVLVAVLFVGPIVADLFNDAADTINGA